MSEAWTLVISKPMQDTGLDYFEIAKGAEFAMNHARDDEPWAEVTADNGQKFWIVMHAETKRILACTPDEMKEYKREGGLGFRVEAPQGAGKTTALRPPANAVADAQRQD